MSPTPTELVVLLCVAIAILGPGALIWTGVILRRKKQSLWLLVPSLLLFPLPVGLLIALLLPANWVCAECGRAISGRALACTYCGAPLPAQEGLAE